MVYRLVYEKINARTAILQKIMLFFAIIIDFFAIMMIVHSVYKSAYYAFLVIGLFAFSALVRMVAIKLCYKVEYKLENECFIVSKIYILSKKILVNCKISEVLIGELQYDSNMKIKKPIFQKNDDLSSELTGENIEGDIFDINDEIIGEYCDLSDQINEEYLLKIDNKMYVCNMDKYMYATLLEGKEL